MFYKQVVADIAVFVRTEHLLEGGVPPVNYTIIFAGHQRDPVDGTVHIIGDQEVQVLGFLDVRFKTSIDLV